VTVVVGTAGHIDHGKTALLRALTGIDADRLPEERRRGMTIDVGYAHMPLPDGAELDFVDVPGHDRLVGNMLVGAGEIDAALLVVAADEGVSAQTREHLELLDALGIGDGLAVLTKLDLLAADDPRRSSRPDEVGALLATTSLAGAPVLAVSAQSGEGLDELRGALYELRHRVEAHGSTPGGPRLAVDRVFTVRGRGLVVTGTLRGGRIARGDALRLEPGGRSVRVREVQVHGGSVESAGGGRVALNLAGVERDQVVRGMVLCDGPAVRATDRLLVALRPVRGGRPPADGAELRVHLGTDEVIGRLRLASAAESAEALGVLRLARPIAAALDDRFVLRWPSPAVTAGGGRILDAAPSARLVRRRPDATVLGRLAAPGDPPARLAALVAAHAALDAARAASAAAALGDEPLTGLAVAAGTVPASRSFLDPTLAAAVQQVLVVAVGSHHDALPLSDGLPLAELRPLGARALRRAAAVPPREAAAIADALIARLVAAGRLERDDEVVRDPSRRPGLPPTLLAAMDRLVPLLRTPAPPPLAEAARAAACPPEGVRALESSGRIVLVAPDLAYATETYRDLESLALALAADGPLTPAALRDATGTSRKYALAILEELDARGLLRRGPDGHRLGPRAPRPGASA
jgi:selenocysteine-specific elongation factor